MGEPMKCQNGHEMPSNSKFCATCGAGADLSAGPPTSAMAAPTTVAPVAAGAKESRRWNTWHVVTASVVALLLGVGIGSAGKTDNKTDASVAPDAVRSTSTTRRTTTTTERQATTTTTERATTTTAAPAGRARTSPAPLGTVASMTDWDVAVLSFNHDGDADVHAANQFNDPPQEGSHYVIVRLRATYQGDKEGRGLELTVGYLGSDARLYKNFDCGAVVDDAISDQPAVTKGGTIEGNECMQVPATVIGTGEIFVEPIFSFDESDRRWWVGA